jgi:octanoyl-[GcvH]:protein N-octanoyltransferase
MQLHSDRFPGQAVLDTAVSHALLRRVARGQAPESLRLYRPDDALLFSSLDARRPGYPLALELARDAGFEPVVRLAGGHAAVFLGASIAFAWATPDPDAALRIRPRFESLAGWVVAALDRLGLDARVGELEGEYCPGEFSVSVALPGAGGGTRRIKVMGVGQRVIRGAAHVGGVITVGATARLREILVPVYEALGLALRPETAGGIADVDPTLSPEDLVEALAEVLRAEGITLVPARFDSAIESEAEALRSFHTPAHTAAGVGNPHALAARGKALIQGGD